MRSKKLGQKTFPEETVEIKCVAEYFEHFDFLEVDYTFYQLLINLNGEPLSSFHVLSEYAACAPAHARFILKVPQEVVARHMWQMDPSTKKRVWAANPRSPTECARLFTDHFYRPANDILGPRLIGFLFESGYERRGCQLTPKDNIRKVEEFFSAAPADNRYHIEERTDWLKTSEYYQFLRERGLGNVFSHWSFLPSLREQLKKSEGFTRADSAVVRLLTPRGVRYEDAYAKYHPFDRLQDEFPEMIRDTVTLIEEASRQAVQLRIAVNNRAGGNAPEITRRIVAELEA